MTEKHFAPYAVNGVWWRPNACARCEKWFPPYMVGVPSDQVDDYCWGHEIEDAVAPYKVEVEQLRNLVDALGKHLTALCNNDVNYEHRYDTEQGRPCPGCYQATYDFEKYRAERDA